MGIRQLRSDLPASPNFSINQKRGYSVSTASELSAMCPGATAKRLGFARTILHSSPESWMRSTQSLCQHSHRKPARVSWGAAHSACRSFRLRDQASLCAMRSSREPNGSWNGSVTPHETSVKDSGRQPLPPLKHVGTRIVADRPKQNGRGRGEGRNEISPDSNDRRMARREEKGCAS